MFYSMQNVERKNNSDGLVIIIEAVSYLLCLQAGICAGFLSAQTNTTTNFVLVTIVTQINSRQKILKFTGGTHDHDWNIWEFKWSFICLLRNPTFQIYFQWRLSEKLCSLRGQKENSVWFHKTDKTFLLLVQLFKTRKKNSGATNSPVATAAWRCLLVYIVAAALLLYLCEKTEQKPLKTSTVSCFHNHQHPENTPLQCFTHTHTQRDADLHTNEGGFTTTNHSHSMGGGRGGGEARRRITETEISLLSVFQFWRYNNFWWHQAGTRTWTWSSDHQTGQTGLSVDLNIQLLLITWLSTVDVELTTNATYKVTIVINHKFIFNRLIALVVISYFRQDGWKNSAGKQIFVLLCHINRFT